MYAHVRPRLLVAGLRAGLLALPACKKKDGGDPDDTTLGMRSTPRSRQLSQNYLKQIGLGIHAHTDAWNHVPVGFYGPDGKVGLSWRVAILPFIEHENLYREFKLNEAWDSEHNKKLIPMMPKIYAPPEIDTNGHTYLRSFSGMGAVMHVWPNTLGKPGDRVRGPRLTDFTDGTSNTLLVAEAAEAVVWTKPDELELKPNGPLPKLGGVYRDGVNVLFGDGSTRFMESDVRPDKLKALITINGGEVIGFDE
jgi:hypothetical protein